MVFPDHRCKPLLLAERVRQVPTRQLEIVHQVVDPLQSPLQGETHTTDDVVQMNPGIDMGAVFGHNAPGGAANH